MEINGKKIMSADELMALSEKFDDRDYRRGYIHGYLAALDDQEAGKSLKDMTVFFNTKLWDWWEEDCSEFVVPPELR